MKQVTKNTEFIIGVDFGHGETSACFYDLKKSNEPQKDLDILPGLHVIKSAVAILEQEGTETICVGDAAIMNAAYAKDFQISFKKRPSEMNKTERGRMVAFMKGVYAEILNRNPDYKSRDHVVYIARPSQDIWNSEEKAYVKIAEDAGLPIAGIQKESRAAFFRARTQPDSKIDSYVKDGVLIVDFGSSTIDFTYLNSKLTKPIDDGRPLGASEVEKTLLKYAMDNPSDGYMPEFVKLYGKDKESIPYNQMLYKFREAKEQYYGKKLSVFSVSFDYGLLTSSEKAPIYGFGGIAIPKGKINEILGEDREDGYIWKVKDAIKSFKKNKLKDNKVACVYLTGGASRMDFVSQIFMEIFNLDEAHCPPDNNPSVIVSQGVAHLSYADIVTNGVAEELKKKAHEAISKYDWKGNITRILYDGIKSKIKNEACDFMKKYRDGKIGHLVPYETAKSMGVENAWLREKNGMVRIRDIKSFQDRIQKDFSSMTYYDFVGNCKKEITNTIINSLLVEIKKVLIAFNYELKENKEFELTGLSARLTNFGAKRLSTKFAGEGNNHILYDAVSSCWITMSGWNLTKDRKDSDRQQHFNHYWQNDFHIYTPKEWDVFLNDYIEISGIETAKKQLEDYIESMIDDYVSYAKLAVFFK